MRQIKFRGKRIDNGEWVEGFLVGSVNPHKVETEYDSWFIHTGATISSFLRVDPSTLGQFTGLLDKNGKEIYEGDIISTSQGGKDIFYDDSCGGFCFSMKVMGPAYGSRADASSGEPEMSFSLLNVYDKEIIGNIHENK